MHQNFRKSDFQILAEGSKSEISGYPKLKRAICQIFRITGISIFRKFRRGRKKILKFFFLVKITTKKKIFRKKNPITQNMRIADFRENVDFQGSVQKRWSLGLRRPKIPIFRHEKSVSRQDFPRFDIFWPLFHLVLPREVI